VQVGSLLDEELWPPFKIRAGDLPLDEIEQAAERAQERNAHHAIVREQDRLGREQELEREEPERDPVADIHQAALEQDASRDRTRLDRQRNAVSSVAEEVRALTASFPDAVLVQAMEQVERRSSGGSP
jgi:hypothetical protein